MSPVRLDPLRWSPGGGALQAGGNGPAIGLEVTGTINSVVRPDGFVDASVNLVRGLTWDRSRVGGEGRQDFRCALGEAVAILLPDPKSRATAALPVDFSPPSAAGVSADGARAVVDFARFFAGTHGAEHIVIGR